MLASGQRRTIHQCSHIRNAQIIRSHLFVAFRATHLRVFSFVYNVGQHYFVCIAAVWTLSPPLPSVCETTISRTLSPGISMRPGHSPA